MIHVPNFSKESNMPATVSCVLPEPVTQLLSERYRVSPYSCLLRAAKDYTNTSTSIVLVAILWMVVTALPILSVWLVCLAHTYHTPWLAYSLAVASLAAAWIAAILVDSLEAQ